MKDTFYFSHDYNARNDLRMQALIDECGPAGYGIFWAITEIMHEEETHDLEMNNTIFKAIAKQMSTSVEQVQTVVKSCLTIGLFIENEDGSIFSKRVQKNIGKRVEISEKRSKAGKISAEKRQNSTPVEQVLTSVQQNSTKERKGKERKEEESKENKENNFDVFYSAYPKKVGKDAALKAWQKKKDKPPIAEILAKLELQKKSEQWQKEAGQYIPLPATYINQGRWHDVIEKRIIRPPFQQ